VKSRQSIDEVKTEWSISSTPLKRPNSLLKMKCFAFNCIRFAE